MKKIIAIIILICFVCALYACGKSGGKEEINYDYTETDEKITYTIWSPGLQLFTNNTNDRVVKYIEEKFNVELNFTGASANWRDKLISIVSDYKNVPDLLFCVPSESYFIDWVKKEVLWPLNGYVEKADASVLNAMFSSNQYKTTTTVNGLNYFVPASTGYTNHSLIVRKDWMKKWNISRSTDENSVPCTISEFTDMLKYFRNNDPDGNGRKDTYGLVLSNNFDFTSDLMRSFGIPVNFKVDTDGSYTLSANLPEYDDFLDWAKEGNSTGYIYPAFYALSEDECRTAFLQGQAGACITNGDRFFDGIYTQFRTLNNEDYIDMLDVIPFPSSDDEKHLGGAVGYPFYWGGWCISQTAKEPMRLVKIMDYLMSEEGQKLLVYGVKNTHYIEENGKIVPNLSERLADGVNAFYYSDNYISDSPDGRWGIGEVLLPSPFIIKDGNIVVNMPYDTYFNDGEIVKKYYALQEQQGVNMINPGFIIDDLDMMDIYSKVTDYVKNYTIKVIAGKNRDSQKNELRDLCANAKLETLTSYLRDHK